MFKSTDLWALKKLEVHRDAETREDYLTATYIVENAHQTSEVRFLRIALPTWNKPHIHARTDGDIVVNLGFGNLFAFDSQGSKNGPKYEERVIEEKVTEMTMDELEKKLGYKVKIVNGKLKKNSSVKNSETCVRCKYSVTECVRDCQTCPHMIKNKESSEQALCPCLTVAYGEPCPYFEED